MSEQSSDLKRIFSAKGSRATRLTSGMWYFVGICFRACTVGPASRRQCICLPVKCKVLGSTDNTKQHSVGLCKGGSSQPQSFTLADENIIPSPPTLDSQYMVCALKTCAMVFHKSPELWWVLQSLMGWPGICRCIIFWVVDNWGASMRVGNVRRFGVYGFQYFMSQTLSGAGKRESYQRINEVEKIDRRDILVISNKPSLISQVEFVIPELEAGSEMEISDIQKNLRSLYEYNVMLREKLVAAQLLLHALAKKSASPITESNTNHPLDDHLLHGELNLVTGHLLGGLDGGMVKEGILHVLVIFQMDISLDMVIAVAFKLEYGSWMGCRNDIVY
uniref:Uncharacterized protein n=1 Tax=Quercus lobata TaxID=97700 RepID=A0A7N2QY07_QUELO